MGKHVSEAQPGRSAHTCVMGSTTSGRSNVVVSHPDSPHRDTRPGVVVTAREPICIFLFASSTVPGVHRQDTSDVTLVSVPG